jgi:hypothetical protein
MEREDLTSEVGMLQWLKHSAYEEVRSALSVERLPGGAAGFVYRAHLLASARPSVIVKHAESYAARAQHWKLDQTRMVRQLA